MAALAGKLRLAVPHLVEAIETAGNSVGAVAQWRDIRELGVVPDCSACVKTLAV